MQLQKVIKSAEKQDHRPRKTKGTFVALTDHITDQGRSKELS